MLFRRKKWLANYLADHNLIKRPKSIWPKALICLAVIFVALLICLIPAAVNGWAIYKKVQSLDASAGQILVDAGKQDLSAISRDLASVESDLSFIKARVKRLGPILLVPSVGKTARTGDQMLAASINLLQGYRQLLGVFTHLAVNAQEGQVAITVSTPAGRQAILKSIADNQSALDNAKVKIANARMELAAISADDLSGAFKEKVIRANSLLSEVAGQSEAVVPLFQYLPDLAGYGENRNYLLLFQNNMEMRPTGGFIGSYGLITVRDGEIVNMFTDDIYNLDKHSKDKLAVPAPWPMTAYNGQKYLFLRDANWSPDWPTSAKQIVWFWKTERANAGLPPVSLDGVIAITPDFIANFLALTGPITADGVTFTNENFALQLEKAVEFDYVHKGLALSERKSIIGDLAKDLMGRLLSSSPKDLLKIWAIVKQDIEEKNIISWLADPEIQNYFAQENWSGEVRKQPDDYLYFVDANLGALKTDAVMQRKVSYGVSVDKDGNLFGRASMAYQHNGRVVSALISKYRTYTRVYVPEGTWFTRAYLQDKKGVTELDLSKEVTIGNESGKRYLGTFLTVDPGAAKTLVVEYRLPDSVKAMYAEGVYNLIVQKQPGTAGHKMEIDLRFDQPIAAYFADNLSGKLSGQNLSYNTDLRVDREFAVKFK